MKTYSFYIGVDIASASFFAASAKDLESKKVLAEFESSPDGFEAFSEWLKQQGASNENTLICMEATGAYGDRLCYFMASHGYSVVVEAPFKVKRAFHQREKTDSVDAQQIAEYAIRFEDQLKLWQPKEQLVEQIQVLLSTREQLTAQKTASANALKSFKKKQYSSAAAEKALEQTIRNLNEQIRILDKEIKKDIDSDKGLKHMFKLVTSIPSVSLFLFSNLLVLTQGFEELPESNQLASYAGIAPFRHESGTSVFKKPKSLRRGPSKLRKLLYLASLSLRTHNKQFKHYFLRKVKEGKNPRLVLNNIANKLLKIICAVLKNKQPFIPNYTSVHPDLLK